MPQKRRSRKMRHKVDNEIVIDYLKSMKMENHPNFLFVSVKLNHSVFVHRTFTRFRTPPLSLSLHSSINLYLFLLATSNRAIVFKINISSGISYAIPCHHLTNYSLFNSIIQPFSFEMNPDVFHIYASREAKASK